MRLYPSPQLSKGLSLAGLLLSLGLLLLAMHKAVEVWQADPNLKALHEMLQSPK